MTQVVLVTGATDGLGKAVSIELARAGATVLVHGRTRDRAEAAVAEIRAASGSELLRACAGDLASLAQVRSLAESVAAAEPRLDVLVNNAGIGTVEPGGGARVESADGHELRFAVNYLAPFLLTRLLEPLLLRSAPARIVNVASAGQAPVDFDDVMLERDYDGSRAYSQSKLAHGDGDVRHRGAAGRTRRDGDLPSPGDVHADQDGAGGRRRPDRLARVGRPRDAAADRRPGARRSHGPVLRPARGGPGTAAGVRPGCARTLRAVSERLVAADT